MPRGGWNKGLVSVPPDLRREMFSIYVPKRLIRQLNALAHGKKGERSDLVERLILLGLRAEFGSQWEALAEQLLAAYGPDGWRDDEGATKHGKQSDRSLKARRTNKPRRPKVPTGVAGAA